MKICYK